MTAVFRALAFTAVTAAVIVRAVADSLDALARSLDVATVTAPDTVPDYLVVDR